MFKFQYYCGLLGTCRLKRAGDIWVTQQIFEMFLPYYFKFKPCSLIFFSLCLPNTWVETQLGRVALLPLSPTLAFGGLTPLLLEPPRPWPCSPWVSAFYPLPFNGEQATTDLYNGYTFGIHNTVLFSFLILCFSTSQFIFEEWDWFFFFPCSVILRLWEGFVSGKSSITNTKVFIKLDGEFWPWKGET